MKLRELKDQDKYVTSAKSRGLIDSIRDAIENKNKKCNQINQKYTLLETNH
jgi:hypothetical protein